MQVELYYCADGNRRFAEIAIAHGFKYGAQLPKTVYFAPEFADQDFKRPRYVGYIQALRKYRPYLASVLDIMEWRRLDEYMMRAEEISQYCTEVMLIPKLPGIIRELPREINGKRVRLGYSVPTGFGKTDVPIDEFKDWPVHLLGGSPLKQLELAGQMNVVSCDGNYAQLMSGYCQFFVPEGIPSYPAESGADIKPKNRFWPTLREANGGENWKDENGNEKDANYEAFRRSCEAIMRMWQEVSG